MVKNFCLIVLTELGLENETQSLSGAYTESFVFALSTMNRQDTTSSGFSSKVLIDNCLATYRPHQPRSCLHIPSKMKEPCWFITGSKNSIFEHEYMWYILSFNQFHQFTFIRNIFRFFLTCLWQLFVGTSILIVLFLPDQNLDSNLTSPTLTLFN